MTKEHNGGVSTRSLILLGAFAALALNRDLRRNLVLGTRDALDNAQSTLNDTVKPALNTAAQQAGHTWETLREDAPERAHHFLENAQDVVGTLAAGAAERATQLRKDAEAAAEQARKEYGPKLDDLQDNLRDATEDQRQKAQKTLQQARKDGKVALANLGDKASDIQDQWRDNADERRKQAEKALKQAQKQAQKRGKAALADLNDKAGDLGDDLSKVRGSVQGKIDAQRRDAQRALARARKDAEKELRSQHKNWNDKKITQAVEKRMAQVHKSAQQEFNRIEKQTGRKGSVLAPFEAALQPAPERSGMSGGLTALLLLGTGAVVLARVPAARQGILSAVDAVSPGAGEQLHSFSRRAREILGGVWLEKLEENTPAAPAAAKPTQAATTGATWGATVEPGSAAASKPAEAPAAPVPTNPAPDTGTAPSAQANQSGAAQPNAPQNPADSFAAKPKTDGTPKN